MSHHTIAFPEGTTYFIIIDTSGQPIHYGRIETYNRMDSGLVGSFETFTSSQEQDYLDRLEELGVETEE